jgi:hypothetical protein
MKSTTPAPEPGSEPPPAKATVKASGSGG